MAEYKPVDVNHHGKQNPRILSDAERVEDMIEGFLAVFHENLNPARIPDRHDVRVVVPDAQWTR